MMMRPLSTAMLTAFTAVLALPATAQETREVTASLTYLQRIALPEEARVVYELRDTSGALILEDAFPTEGRQVPVEFLFAAPAGQDTVLSAAIFVAGEPAWIGEPVAIPAGTEAVTLAPVQLAAYRPMGFATTWDCGGTAVTLGFAGETARLRIGADFHDLAQVVTASGARFESPEDPGTWAWNKGDELTVSIRGTELPLCHIPLATLPQPALTARGNEPGWRIDLSADGVRVVTQEGESLAAALPDAEPVEGGRRYVFPEIPAALTVTDGLCRDTMTGMPYPAHAAFERGDGTMTGCAGDPADLLKGVEWVVEDIGGAGIIDSSHVTLTFEDGRVAGSAGCNRFFAGFTLSGEGIRFDRAGSTMMACAPALMEQERRFLDALASVDAFDISDTGALVLTSGGTPVITARH